MSRFPRFFTQRALLLARNDGSIRAPIITENDGFFYNADGTRSQSIRQVFSVRSPQAEATISRVSLFMAIQTHTLSLLRKTKDRNSSTSSTGIFLHSTGCSVSSRGGRSFACSFNQALNVRARDPKRPFNPAHTGSFLINIYNEFFLFFRRAFFALKYAIGTTGFTVILRATGRICAIFNEIFALTFATAVYFKSR